MNLPPPQPEQKSLQSPPLHSDDTDEDDQSVKQLRECSSLYLTLQVYMLYVYITLSIVTYYHYVYKSVNHLFIFSYQLQDCLIKNDRNWKSCQTGMPFYLHSCFLKYIRFTICDLKNGLVFVRVVLQRFIYVYKCDSNY